jgi:hypothetical protein
MSEDLVDGWRAQREGAREEKAGRRDHVAARLEEFGVPVVSKNGGTHLILFDGVVDYWPGTGVYIFRKDGGRGRGFGPLQRELRTRGLVCRGCVRAPAKCICAKKKAVGEILDGMDAVLRDDERLDR